MNDKNDTGTLAAECDRAAIDPGDTFVALRDDSGEFGSWYLGAFGDEDRAAAAVQEDADLHAMMPEGEHTPVIAGVWQALPFGNAMVRNLAVSNDPHTAYRILCSTLNQSLAG
jgi:hypothetical protein